MINFTELKEKICEFNDEASAEMHDIFENINQKSNIRRGQIFKHAQLMQFDQDAKIISELLDVIEMQSGYLNHYENIFNQTSKDIESGFYLIAKCYAQQSTINLKTIKEETESKLKQLTKD
jgi:hypothetical protein